jgi:MraZ protein
MFRGATKITVDDKGRVVVPTRHRRLLSAPGEGRVVVTVDTDECLLVYPAPDWEPIEEKLMALPTFDARSRRIQRLMVGHAEEIEIDSHGRISLSSELREFAGITRAAWIVGQGNRLEIWDEGRWNLRRAEWIKAEQAGTQVSAALENLQL